MLNFRNMTEKDLMDIFALEQSIFTDAWSMCALADTFRQEHSLVLVAEEDQKVKGYCIVYYVLEEGDIVRIAVEQNARRVGVGAQILRETLLQCKGRGVDRVTLEVRKSNEAAIALYKKHGFEEIGVRRDYYQNPAEDGIIMVQSGI